MLGFFKHYSVSARTFYTGQLCNSELFDSNKGHLHLIKSGKLTVSSPFHAPLNISKPSLLFYPQSTPHSFDVIDITGVDLVCATIDIGSSAGNPLAKALPQFLLLPFHIHPELSDTLTLLFKEAFDTKCGRLVAIDNLTEYLLIQLLRYILDSGQATAGLLAGMGDKRLAKTLLAIHEQPQRNWTLESLAYLAGMSRASFALHFRKTLGITPGGYIAQWRVGLVKELLKKDLPINLIAHEVGYGSSSALSRAFHTYTGMSPREWKSLD